MHRFHYAQFRRPDYTVLPVCSAQAAMIVTFLISLSFGVTTAFSQKRYSDDQIARIKAQAEKGSAEEQWMLGHLYYFGDRGLGKDFQSAADWYRKAAVQGHPRAQLYLGKMHQEGEAVRKDSKEAFYWISKAANAGDADAQYALAHAYLDGKGIAKDQVEALNWFKRAAFQNHSAAQGWCGYFYVNGIAVPQDYVEAYAWQNLSAANDSANASLRELRDEIAKLLTKEQIANGQNRTTELQREIQAAIAKKNLEANVSGSEVKQDEKSKNK